MIYSKALNRAFEEILSEDSKALLLGEDIVDPYGGAFKVTRGLSEKFPDRVRSTPVSEGAIVGVSAGLALGGYRPIAEIMFGDFVSLCFDQLVNHISKYKAMYDGKVSCPVIVRTPFGGGRGYGPTHSQSLEKHFLGVPNLNVWALSLYHQPLSIYRGIMAEAAPALVVEHKMLYPREFEEAKEGMLREMQVETVDRKDGLGTVSLAPVDVEDCEVTVVAYGYQASVAEEVARQLAFEKEIFVELLVPARIDPIELEPIQQSVGRTGRLVTVEEGTDGFSWGGEVARKVYDNCLDQMKSPARVLTSESAIIPSARNLEDKMLISASQIRSAIEGCL